MSSFRSPPPVPNNYSFASKEDLEDLQLLVNESFKSVVQQMKDGDTQNHDHIQQLQKKISDVEKQSNSRGRSSVAQSRQKSRDFFGSIEQLLVSSLQSL